MWRLNGHSSTLMKPRPEIAIREATLKDAAEIGRLARRIWPVCYRDIISTEQIDYMLDQRFGAETLVEALENPAITYWVAELDCKLVGYGSVEQPQTGGRAKIQQVYLLPSVQGIGVGRRLLEQMILHVREQGGVEVWLTVNRKNDHAIEFYRRQGFVVERELVTDIGRGFVMNDFVMTYTLEDEQ